MHSISTLLLLALLPSVLSIKITSPSDDSELAIGGANQATTVQWDSVNTDPTSFAVVLVNQNSAYLPNSPVVLNENVTTSDGSIGVQFPNGGWPTGTAFQINFVKTANEPNSILAQSDMFNITASTSSSSSSSSSSTSTSSSSTRSSSSSIATGSSTSTGSAVNPSNSGAVSGDIPAGASSSSSSTSSALGRYTASIPLFPAVAVAAAMTLGGAAVGSML